VHRRPTVCRWFGECAARRREVVGALVAQFREGAALLFVDLRVAWRHRRMPRVERRRRLGRRELLAAQRAFWDLARVLPVLANPLPPPLGLSLIALAYRWPRWMLPPQFHSQDQRAAFAKLDAASQARAAAELRARLLERRQQQSLRVAAAADADDADFLQQVFRDKNAVTTQAVAHFSEEGPWSLASFSRRDLRRLLEFARPRCVPFLACCCPSFVVRRVVAHAAADIDDDDALLLKPGRDADAIRQSVLALSRTDLLDACVARGLLGGNDDGNCEDRLVDWLQRRVVLDQSWPHKHAPPAFLFCQALLLHHNHTDVVIYTTTAAAHHNGHHHHHPVPTPSSSAAVVASLRPPLLPSPKADDGAAVAHAV